MTSIASILPFSVCGALSSVLEPAGHHQRPDASRGAYVLHHKSRLTLRVHQPFLCAKILGAEGKSLAASGTFPRRPYKQQFQCGRWEPKET